MHDFLDVIQRRMLLVEPLERVKSDFLVEEFKRLQEKATYKPEYIMEPRPKAQPVRPTLHVHVDRCWKVLFQALSW
jgi:hypothetical protein